MLNVVVGWDLYEATRSPVVLGNVGLVQIIPVLLFTLAAGHLADRYDRRRILVASQLVVASTGIVLAMAGSYRTVSVIYGCLFAGSLARAFQWPASSATLPRVVAPEHFSTAITWYGIVRELATVTVPAIAGLLLALFALTTLKLM